MGQVSHDSDGAAEHYSDVADVRNVLVAAVLVRATNVGVGVGDVRWYAGVRAVPVVRRRLAPQDRFRSANDGVRRLPS